MGHSLERCAAIERGSLHPVAAAIASYDTEAQKLADSSQRSHLPGAACAQADVADRSSFCTKYT